MNTYKSKIGIKIIMFLTLVLSTIILFMVFQNEPVEQILSVSGIFLGVYALYLYINFSTEYTITEDGILNVKCGFFYNKRFDINKIKSIAKTCNLISSPAPSLDRIELIYDEYDIIVLSPKNKIGFARELIKVNPKIENKLPK